MQGIELARGYFEEYGRPMLEEQFSDVLPYLACGLFGSGSECFGFDDEISKDHDFEPGFMLLLPDETVVDRRREFQLERAYAKLPKEYGDAKRAMLQPVGGARHGVLRTAEVFERTVGDAAGALSLSRWLTIPTHALAEAVNGELFFDNYGEVSRIRESLACFPEEVRLKRLAGHLLLMAQAGQYNYPRCLSHGETGAAQLAAGEFVKNTISAVFLLNNRYEPYYKWSFRALRTLPVLAPLADALETIISTGNDEESAFEKNFLIGAIAEEVIAVLQEQGITKADCGDLEKHAYSVNDHIPDAEVRNLHVLAAV